MQQIFICLSLKKSAQWILDADIKACFDQISHEWLLANISMYRLDDTQYAPALG